MTSLPYKTADVDDLADIPLSDVQTPHHHPQSIPARTSDESVAGPPPPRAHILHHHRASDPRYYEAVEPANQAGYPLYPHNSTASHDNASASGSNGDSSNATTKNGWTANQDTLVERNHRPTKIALPTHHDPFEPPQAPFAGAEALNGRTSRASSIASSADESEDFDWDTDSDAQDEDEDAARKSKGRSKKVTRAKRGRKIYLACISLARPVRIFIAALIGTAVCLIPFIVVTVTDNQSPARAQVLVWSIWIAIIWAASCGTFLVVDWLPPVALRLVIAVYGKAPEIVKTYIEAFMATTLYVKLVLCITWAWISLSGVLAIQYSSSTRPSYWRTVFMVIRALFATSIILLVEKVALQFIAINFHKTAVKDRLEQNQKALKALDKLHESKYLMQKSARARFNPMRSRPASPGYKLAYSQHAAKQSRDGLGGYFAAPQQADANAAAQSEEKLPSGGHHHHFSMHRSHENSHSHSHTPSEHHTRKAERKTNIASQISDAIAMATMKDSKLYKGNQLGSQRSARKLAKLLFTNLSDHKSTLAAQDFVPYFKSEEEACEAFNLFDADRNGDISKEEMREAVQRIYRERRALSTSLKDMSSAISKLDGVLMFIGLIIVVFIWLLIFNGDSAVSNIVPLSTFVVGFSFIFGNSAKNIFESMIFIFATHPYDVGDLVCIDEEWMFVKEFGLLSTTFRTTVNAEIVAPNAMLATQKYIYNSRRSGAQWEVTMIQLSFDTSLESIEQLRLKLRAWVKENDREFGGGLDLNFNSITQQNAVELVVAFEHKGNWQDWGARWERRTKLMRRIKTACEELRIVYSMPPQPITFHPRSGPSPFKLGNSSAGIDGLHRSPLLQQQPQQAHF
ncbi:uncharacterized protein UBRO_08136 [Ustilago bromivora]|uniref:EF-hand domain-containing protein n=1 Tax=Ustilago bromivora TaxID=307758 RepID=A0A1K0GBY1_9BASI|nr:uncharacterized protein UBRO_08136 [Ustilago bromivora]SYW80498.1 uncharacterized protein UBRO2_03766 [Ustilago bromivora]